MNLKFKKAEKENIAVIAQLAENIWRRHYSSIISMEQIEYMLNKMYASESILRQMDEGHQFTIVYINDKPIGYSSVSTKDGRNYFLQKFYVELKDHGKGVGSALFTHLLKQLNKPETIELTVNRKNYKAINFYFKNGFVIKETADFEIGNGYFMNDFVMVKKMFL